MITQYKQLNIIVSRFPVHIRKIQFNEDCQKLNFNQIVLFFNNSHFGLKLAFFLLHLEHMLMRALEDACPDFLVEE